MDYLNTTTTTSPPVAFAPYWGYLGLVIAILFFASNFLPVKKYETGDGIFFQFILCIGIWSVGFIVQWIRNFPTFYALPMLGGFLWTTANINTVPIIKCIGIGMGTLLWCTSELLIGWASARFGWFNVKPELPRNEVLNYIGVAFAAISGLFFLLIKSETHQIEDGEREPLLDGTTQSVNNDSVNTAVSSNFFDRLNPKAKRILGTIMSCITGVLFGFMFIPYLYVVDNYENASENGLDYVFSLYSGILISSIFYFSIYCIVMRNRIDVNPAAIFPGLVSGWMWGIACCAYTIANSALSQAVAFPMVACGPPVIASLYGIFLYKEITGKKNFVILACGFVFAITGATLCGLSK